MAPSLIHFPSDWTDARLVGGKAVGLANVIRAGLPVPPGLCLTTALYRHGLETAGVDAASLWRRAQQASDDQLADLLAPIRTALLHQPWPAGMEADVRAHLSRLHADPSVRWAVRSSATNEDAADASAAGLYLTKLGQAMSQVTSAVRDCWWSLWAPHVLHYWRRAGREGDCPEMAVVIQPMLEARAAGVAYSIHPVTGRRTQVTINAVPGLAAGLVDGRVTPDQFVVESAAESGIRRVRRTLLARKPTKLVTTTEGVSAQPIPDADQTVAALSEDQLLELAQAVKRLETAFQCPVDVEWAWDAERLWILQARPITAVQPTDHLTDDDCEWTRANFKETSPELPSPAGLAFLAHFMERHIIARYHRLGCVIPPGLSAVRIRRGRPYLNFTLFYLLSTQLHADPAYMTEQMGGEPPAVTPPVRPLGPLAMLRAGLYMLWEWQVLARQGAANFEAMKRMVETYRPDRIRDWSPQQLGAALDEMGQWLESHEVTFGIVAGVAQSLQAMGKLLPRRLGPDWRELLNASLQGQGTVISARQIVQLAEVVEAGLREPLVRQWCASEPWTIVDMRMTLAGTAFLDRFEQYLRNYGHRAIGESDVMSPRLAEQPEQVVALLRMQIRSGEAAAPRAILDRQSRSRAEALTEIRRRFGSAWHRWVVFQWWYRRLSRFCAAREANRHHLMYYAAAARGLLVRLGEVMVERGVFARPDDIFYLTLDERLLLCQERTDGWAALVQRRRAEQARHALSSVPDTIRDWPSVTEGSAAETLEASDKDGELRGIAISAGDAHGPVRLVRSVADWGRVQPGDIIVVPVIDPGMAPLFGVAAGLIADMGGTLSHGAIMVREYGLPALVNVSCATERLREHELVTITSADGTIRRAST